MSNHDKEKVHNMTPNVSEKEAKEVRDKFDATYMKGRGKVEPKQGEIKDIPKEQIDAAKKGAAGGLGLIGGVAKGLVKAAGAFANTAKQYARGGEVAKKTSNFRPLITGNKVYGRKEINDAFKSRFGPETQQTIRPPQSPSTNFGRVDRASQMRNIERGNIGKTPRFAKPPVKK